MKPHNGSSLKTFPPENFIRLQQKKIRKSKISNFKINGVAKISAEVIESGIRIHINKHSLKLQYPESVWKRFPHHQKKIFADNVAYSLTFHLPFLFPTLKKMNYSMAVPISEAFIYKCFSQGLPATALTQTNSFSSKTSNLLRRLYFTEYTFDNKKTEIPPYNRISNKNNIVMPFTFGKDSLLTFALCKELNINTNPIFIAEPHLPFEEKNKRDLSVDFQKEFKLKINFLKNTIGLLRDPDPNGFFGWEMQLTQYSLMLLPYVYAQKAGYILFSNEQSCDNVMIDADGFKCNPVFEQSHQWLLQNSLLTSLVGGNSLSIGTLIEPLHDLAIIKILHYRYPEIGKFQSSCDHQTKPGMRWCENCSKCARIYILLLANGVNPKRVGFKTNLLRASKKHLYPTLTPERIQEFGYDNSEAARDEQIYAFYLAYKKGAKGPAIDGFKKRYLKYAKKHEEIFKKTYYGIHSATTVPYSFAKKVLKIFHEELDKKR